jgi:hypothetical protein
MHKEPSYMLIAGVFERVRHAAHVILVLGGLATLTSAPALAASSVTLAWDPSTDPAAAGYHLYYGTASRSYTNMVDTGGATTGTVSNLSASTTYYFAATTYNLAGLESVYSGEASYTMPTPPPPTLNAINNMTVNENSGQQTVNLTGISSGSTGGTPTLTVSAFSSAPTLIPNPTVTYTSPNTTGSIKFTPVTNSFGTATLTVMVDNGNSVSNTVIRAFTVTIVPPLVTNATIAPGNIFRFTITSPISNKDNVTISLDPGAPAGATIVQPHGNGKPQLSWRPSTAQASTTNLVTIRFSDTTNPTLTTTETLQVVVQDYLNVAVGQTAVQAGQTAVVPIYLASSGGATNVSFTIGWPTNRVTAPALSNAVSSVGASSVQVQSTNLLVTVRAASGQVLQTTNAILQLSFQTVANQSSAFVRLPGLSASGNSPAGAPYVNPSASGGRVVVVKDVPLLESLVGTNGTRTLALYGRVGTNYQVESSTSFSSKGSWTALTTYPQTNVTVTIPVGTANPVVFYRLLQK